jgi:type VI secretion system protein VasD
MHDVWGLEMKLIDRAKAAIVALLIAVLAAGCTVANMAVNPYEKIALIGADDLNPDVNGRPSPVRVKIFHLSSRATFDNLDFDELFYNAKNLLSDELILEQTYTLQPKQKIKETLPVDKGTQYVAVLAAYRDIDNAQWRHIMEISDRHYYSHRYDIGQASIIPVRRNRRSLANKELFDNTLDTAKKTESTVGKAESIKETAEAAAAKLP